MFRNMVTSLILNGRITTTDAKAKELRRYADRMITLGKRQTLAARRRASRFVRTDAALSRLFGELAPLFATRAGGYTRIVKVAHRRGDAAPLSVVELTEQPAADTAKGAEKPKGKKAAAKSEGKPAERKSKAAETKSKTADSRSKGKKAKSAKS
jgi:large subunit ribosomal protein L17